MEYCGNINNSCWEVAAIKGWHTHNTQRKLQEFPWEAEKNFLQLRAELKRHNNGNSHALHQLYYSFAEGKTRQLFLCALTRLSLISLFSLCSTDTNILQEIIDRLSLAAREYPSIPRLIQPTVFPAYYSSIHMKPTQRAQAFGAVCFDKFLFHLFFLVHAAEWQQKLRQWENETRRKEIDRRCNWEMCEVVAVRMSCLVRPIGDWKNQANGMWDVREFSRELSTWLNISSSVPVTDKVWIDIVLHFVVVLTFSTIVCRSLCCQLFMYVSFDLQSTFSTFIRKI